MVVALHLEDAGEAVAYVDHAGILAGALNDPRRFGRQSLEVQAGGFVGTMLVPHGGENAEFGQRRLAADQLQNTLIFIRLQTVLGDEFGGDCDGIFHQAAPR